MKLVMTILLLLFSLLLISCQDSNTPYSDNPTATPLSPTPTSLPQSPDMGRAVFVITDAAAELEEVSEINMRISNVEVYSATKGWVTVSSTPEVYNLLDLKADSRAALIASVPLDEGTYNQMRVNIQSVTIVDDDRRTHSAVLPSSMMTFNTTIRVEANETSSIQLDVLADESLHLSTDNKYVVAPVVNVKTRSDVEVDMSNEDDVTVTGGRLVADTTIGMDIRGNVGIGLRIPSNINLTVSGNIISTVGGSVGGMIDTGIGINSDTQIDGSLGTGNVAVGNNANVGVGIY